MLNKKQLAIFYFLSFTWALLWTLVGLFTLLFISIFMKNKVEIRTIAGRIAIHFKEGNFGGASLGIVYLIGRHNSRRTNLHELGHSLQHIWWGPFFIPVIAIPSAIRCGLWDKIKKWYYKKNGVYPLYDGIWFEGQATRLGYKHFEEAVDQKL